MERVHHPGKSRLLASLLGFRKEPEMDVGIINLIQTLSNAVTDPLIITDHQFTIHKINNSVKQRFGYSASDLNGKRLSELFPANQWVTFEAACLAYTSQPDPYANQFSRTVAISTKQNLELSAVVSMRHLPTEQGGILVFQFHHVKPDTEAQQLTQQKRQQQLRLQAVGRLTAGLAHEYNNLLTSIIGYSDILRMRLSQDEALSRYIDHISRASNRAADLTRHVMAFSRHRLNQPEMCDLNTIVTDMEKMIRGLFEEDTELVFQLTPQPAMIRIDFGALVQVLIIVLLSVREHLARNSQVIIATKRHNLRSDCSLSTRDDRSGEFVNLAIRHQIKTTSVDVDRHNATVPLELREMQDDLEGVFNLVRHWGGEINTVHDSASKKTYNILLPVGKLPTERLLTEDVSPEFTSGSETILVVDDEDMIRDLIREALQMEGYQVLEASRPIEAIQVSRQYQHTIHLLVSDVVMPDMNGRELADQLVIERPHLRLLFISGHSPHLLTRSGVDSMEGRFLQKPFSTSTLIEKVRSALTAPSSHSVSE
jgi:two-component system cell cycle sensor histidine kinase/response regulator CckA